MPEPGSVSFQPSIEQVSDISFSHFGEELSRFGWTIRSNRIGRINISVISRGL